MISNRAYIIILNYNGCADTLECLDSLIHLNYSNFRVIICDNASTDDSKKEFNTWRTAHRNFPVTFIYNNANLGYAGGNNVGIRMAMEDVECNYVWFLNNDTIVDRDALKELVLCVQNDSAIGLCGSLLYCYGTKKVQAINGIYNPILATSHNNSDVNVNHKYTFPVGASMMATRNFIETVGFLCEDYFLYYEEIDWVLRAKEKFKITYASRSIVYHKEGASIGSRQNPMMRSKMSDFYVLKNRITVTKKFFPKYLPTVYLGLFISIINRLKRGQYDRAFMIWHILRDSSISYNEYILTYENHKLGIINKD